MTEAYDFVVVGSGPAGEKGAAHAAYFGKKVALVERSPNLGGAPVGTGGIPTKTLRETALYVTGFHKSDVYGVRLDLDAVQMLDVLRQRNDDVRALMARLVRENIERHGIEVVRGDARLEPDLTVVVSGPEGERRLRAGAVLLATGSRPFHPSGLPMDDPDVHDSDTILELDRPFGDIVVIGGGPIGCEYASIFGAFGVAVTLVDNGPRLLPFMDAEISAELAGAFSRMGVDLRQETQVARVGRVGERLEVELSTGELIHPQKVLVAAGRAGNTETLGLTEAGVELDPRGRVIVDASYRTSVPGVYAAGDVIGPPALASVSMEQGRLAASHAMETDYRLTAASQPPFAVYSVPEVAMVGLTEEAARAAGVDYAVGRSRFESNARANIAGAPEGMLKLVFRREDRRLLGVHVIGEIASEIVHQGQAVLQHEGQIDYFIHSTFNVPTWSDSYKYAAFDGLGKIQPGALTAPTDAV